VKGVYPWGISTSTGASNFIDDGGLLKKMRISCLCGFVGVCDAGACDEDKRSVPDGPRCS